MKNTKYLIFTLLVITSMLISACGAADAQDPFVQTAVAQTVAAKNAEQNTNTVTSTPEAPDITQTPLQFSPTLTPLASAATATAPVNTGSNACAKASLVSETILDGTVFRPGSQFTKTWEIKNISTCTWDTNYKIIFWDGDILGGAYYYNLPQAVPAGGVVPISLVLTAPAADGDYTSKWVLQTPDKTNFGVGDYSAPFYANIVVSSAEKPEYAITSVTYEMVREPATGCPANITYTAYATVTTNGPLTFNYYWAQSDGHNIKGKIIKTESAESIVLTNSWQLHIATTPGTRWMALAIGFSDGENYQYTVYPQIEFTKLCGG